MATYGKKLLDSNNNVILPKTRSSLVYMDNNETVEDEIGKILDGSLIVGKSELSKELEYFANPTFTETYYTSEELGADPQFPFTVFSKYAILGKFCFGYIRVKLLFDATVPVRILIGIPNKKEKKVLPIPSTIRIPNTESFYSCGLSLFSSILSGSIWINPDASNTNSANIMLSITSNIAYGQALVASGMYYIG